MADRSLLLILLGALVLTAPITAAAPFEVPLTVTESAGVARAAEPVSGGVPLPKGRFPKGQVLALSRADGEEIPCQTLPLVVETDGTLRWVLLDFQDDLPAGRTARYILRARRPAATPATRLRVRDEPSGVTVDTGRARFRVSRAKPFGLFDTVAVGGRAVVTGGRLTCTQLYGRTGWDDPAPWKRRALTAGPPESVRIVYNGPLRATVEVTGHFADDPHKLGYRAWITAWAGHSRTQVKLTLCNSNPDRYTLIALAGASVSLALAGEGGEVVLGAARPVTSPREGWLHQGLTTGGDSVSAKAGGPGGKVLWEGSGKERAAGWIARRGASAVFACDRLFASDPARRLAVTKDSRLVLEAIAPWFGAGTDRRGRPVGRPWYEEHRWLFDCSHHSSEYLLDFDLPEPVPAAGDQLARASRNRLWVLAPGAYYSRCEATGIGRFGTLADELTCYRNWGLTAPAAEPAAPGDAAPDAFVPFEDNHYESEADSVEALLLMYIRTGKRAWFDLAEAWARYHVDLQTWRTDGWRWKDGAIWFPQGGPLGTRPERKKWNFTYGPPWGDRKASADCKDLWRHCIAKSCYCHYYGAGVADWYCLTGDPDALAAAIDNVETKDNEFRKHHQLQPGRSEVHSIRGFGRGFQVLLRTLNADPGNRMLADLAHLCARTLWQSPQMDERGFPATGRGASAGLDSKAVSAKVRAAMRAEGITLTESRGRVESLTKAGRTWPVTGYGGAWQHVYIQNGADAYARRFDDDDMRDFTVAFAQMSAKYMRSRTCHQTWYRVYFDIPALGEVFDPWVFDHADTTDGEGCVHSGYYTRHYPDACAKGYSWTGERRLLEEARRFWYYGSKRAYRTKRLRGGPDEIGKLASHRPPKDDDVLAVSRLFHEAAHPRADAEPPAAVGDLRVRLLGEGKAEVRFTAPADAGGGRVVLYQVKAATLPIVPYEQWDYARDLGKKRNWWRAVNCADEPAPDEPGTAEQFVVTGVPTPTDRAALYFAVRSFDNARNRSALSNLARL